MNNNGAETIIEGFAGSSSAKMTINFIKARRNAGQDGMNVNMTDIVIVDALQQSDSD